MQRIGRVVSRVRFHLANKGRQLALACRSDVNRVSVRRTLGGGERESLQVGDASMNPRESSLYFLSKSLSVEGFNSRKRREATTLSLGLTRVRLIGQVVKSAPVLLLSSILSRLSGGERGCLLSDVRSVRAIVAYAKLSRFMGREFSVGGVFRIGDKRMTGRG